MKSLLGLATSLAFVILTCHAVAMDLDQAAQDIIDRIAQSGLEPEINGLIEFEAARAGYGPGHDPAIEISAPGDWAMIGYDGAGGAYYLLEDQRILAVGSEGAAGVVAKDFGAFIATLTSLPSWREAVRHMGPDDVETARAGWLAYAAQWGLLAQYDEGWPYQTDGFSYPTPRAAGQAIRAHFGVEGPADPFAALHEAIHGLNDDVSVAAEGYEYEPLSR
jgi:hypothetical protein|tara:strand:+ start:5546 stop:6205 length:660 start_codon:yes stop_codon:yes gene_type:complete